MSTLTIHELKCWPEFFNAVKSGEKTFEIRKDDRGFRIGHWLRLMSFDPDNHRFLNERPIDLEITYILTGSIFGLRHGYVCLGFKRAALSQIEERSDTDPSTRPDGGMTHKSFWPVDDDNKTGEQK